MRRGRPPGALMSFAFQKAEPRPCERRSDRRHAWPLALAMGFACAHRTQAPSDPAPTAARSERSPPPTPDAMLERATDAAEVTAAPDAGVEPAIASTEGPADPSSADARRFRRRRVACDSWESMEAAGGRSGLIRNRGGVVHRPRAVRCVSTLPVVPLRPAPAGQPPGALTACTGPADCAERPYGSCEFGQIEEHGFCVYGCAADSDCGDGYLCVCGEGAGRCVSARCTADAACGRGLLCARHYSGNTPGFACTSPEDTCYLDCDCPSVGGAYRSCVFDGRARVCAFGGRPVD